MRLVSASRFGVASIVVALCLGCSEAPGGDPASEGGEASPTAETAAAPAVETLDFTLPDLEGAPVTLADFRGKTVIVDFWATWCPPCLFQVPELNEFWSRNEASGEVMVIGVAVDVEGAEVVKPWAIEQDVQYQLVLGDESLARDFGAMGFPTLVILNPDGSVHSRHVGLVEADELENLVAASRGVDET